MYLNFDTQCLSPLFCRYYPNCLYILYYHYLYRYNYRWTNPYTILNVMTVFDLMNGWAAMRDRPRHWNDLVALVPLHCDLRKATILSALLHIGLPVDLHSLVYSYAEFVLPQV